MQSRTDRHRAAPAKSGDHGHFKHVVSPATLDQMLSAYGLTKSQNERLIESVKRFLRKAAA